MYSIKRNGKWSWFLISENRCLVVAMAILCTIPCKLINSQYQIAAMRHPEPVKTVRRHLAQLPAHDALPGGQLSLHPLHCHQWASLPYHHIDIITVANWVPLWKDVRGTLCMFCRCWTILRPSLWRSRAGRWSLHAWWEGEFEGVVDLPGKYIWQLVYLHNIEGVGWWYEWDNWHNSDVIVAMPGL